MALIALAGVYPVEAANAPPLMAIPGKFEVSSAGAATYTVPIAVPPGTGNVAPKLSLGYSSQNADGILGIGWAIDGLMAIDRCPRTLAQDSVHGSVKYDYDDRFCLGSQRLILISGTYGHDLSEYRTEIDGFSRIIAHGTAGNGPIYFEIHTKAGQIIELGNTADSQVLATGTSTAREWAVNKISDTVGNYLTITYNSASGGDRTTYGEVYPIRIDYTGNANAGVSPYNSVQFVYTTRADSTPTYQAGSLLQGTVLLTDIKTYQGASLVTDYQLGYRAGGSGLRSRLTSLTQYDGSGHSLPATTFSWQGGLNQFNVTSTANPYSNGAALVLPGDFNGDGLTDFSIINPSAGQCPPYPVFIGTGSGFSTSSYTLTNGASIYSTPNCGIGTPLPSTILAANGTSMIGITISGQNPTPPYNFQTFATILTTAGPINLASLPGPYSTGASPVAGDYNGDGIPDFFQQVQVTGANSYYYIGPSYTPSGPYSGLSWADTGLVAADFDGDGCTDFFAQQLNSSGTNGVIFSPYCSGVSGTAPLPSGPGNGYVAFGDFNGDGKTDVIIETVSLGLWLSTGPSFTDYTDPLPFSNLDSPFYVGDFNGDGKSDIMDGHGRIWLSTGSSFVQALDQNGNPITITIAGTPVIADWNSDGASEILMRTYTGSGTNDTIYSFSYVPEVMTGINNGVGATTTITYDRINKNGSFYTKGTSATYPTQDLDGPIYVVSRVDASNGLGACPGNCYSSTYSYASAQTDLQGRGFLGFGQITITDLQTSVVQTTNYNIAFPYIGMITSQTKKYSTTTISSITNTLNQNSGCGATPAGTGVYVICTTQTVTATSDLGGAFPTVTVAYTFDNYGNPLTANETTTYGASTSTKNTTNTYSNDTTHWYLGKLLTTSVNNHVGSSNLTRNSSFSYDTTTGLLIEEVLEPGVSTCNGGASSCTLTMDYTLDPFGNRISTTLSGTGITTRTNYSYFDALGQFKMRASNALGQNESWAYDARFGLPTSQSDLNQLTTTWSYDGFGRLTQEYRSDGTQTKASYATCSGACPTYGSFLFQTEAFASDGVTQIGAVSTIYYDMLGRTIATDKQGFNGSVIRVATSYNANLQVSQTSRPYYIASDTPRLTSYAYEPLGRVQQATFPDSSHTTYTYAGLVTTVTNNLSQTTTTTKNPQGLIASVQDASLHTTSYVYDAFGNAIQVTDAAGNVVTNTFDIRGNKVSSIDPDMGTWTYSYNVLGKLTSQTDAKSQSTTLTYDLLNRPLTRTEVGLFSSWTYGASVGGHNVGKLIEAEACSTSACSSIISDRTFAYDAFSRPSSNTLHTGGSDYGYNQNYNTTNGMLSNLAYPSGFSANYTYNSFGYLTFLADDQGSPLWAANAMNAESEYTSETQGNGVLTTQVFDPNTGLLQSQRAGGGAVASFDYTFDTLGNLLSRADNNESFTERLCYTDALNRLTNSNIGSVCTGGKTESYDNIGNITAKTGAGTYSYPSTGSARPHAVSSITGTVDGLVNPKYTYDGNGNLTCVSTATSCGGTVGRQLTVTSFNIAATLIQGSISIALTYDDQHNRIAQATTISGSTTKTTYLNDSTTGAMSQKVQVGSAVPQWVDYLQVAGQIIAQRTVVYQSGSLWGFSTWGSFNWGPPTTGSKWGSFNWGSGTWTGPLVTWAYFSLDNLNSVAVISDQGGNVIQRLSYDPWGKQRNANGTDASCGTITPDSTRGFTNQEQMPTECLVNLNARIYDPSIGRFMSPDSIVQDPTDGQSLNRFSYVNNNPLASADPSGHFDVNGNETVFVNGGITPFFGAIGGCSGACGATPTDIGYNPPANATEIAAALAQNSSSVAVNLSNTPSGPPAPSAVTSNPTTGSAAQIGSTTVPILDATNLVETVVVTATNQVYFVGPGPFLNNFFDLLGNTVSLGGQLTGSPPARPGTNKYPPRPGSNNYPPGAICPRGVSMLSVSGSLTIPFFPKSISLGVGFGIAVDPHGNVAVPAFGFAGGAYGAAESLTGNFTTSNATNFTDFGGAFAEGGAIGGIGGGGGFAGFAGANSVSGTTHSLGEVMGLSAFGGASYTDIGPTLNLGGLLGCH